MLRRASVGILGVLWVVAACGDDAPSNTAMAGAGVGGSAVAAGAGGTRAAAGSQSQGGFGGGGRAPTVAAGEGSVMAAPGGAGGDVGGDAGGDASSGGGAGAGGAGGDAGLSGAGGQAGEAGQAGQGPGVCEAGIPAVLPSCSPNTPDPDGGNECRVCLKAQCCDAWQQCFGHEPRNACGYGAPVGDDIGEADCITLCWYDQRDGLESDEEILDACATACAACPNLISDATNELVACAYTECRDDCYPRP